MTIFITGATGFVGQNLIDTLCEQGMADEVCCLVRSLEKAEPLRQKGIRLVHGDLANPESYQQALVDTEQIIHTAALVGLRDDPAFYHANTVCTERLVQAAQTHSRHLKRLLFVSSISAIDRNPEGDDTDFQPLKEGDPAYPQTDYGRSKYQAEVFIRQSGVPFTIARPPYIYGPYPRLQSSMDRLLLAVVSGESWTRIPYPGAASEIFVRDLTDALWMMATHPQTLNEDFYVTNPTPTPFTTFVSTLAECAGLTFVPRKPSAEALARLKARMIRHAAGNPLPRILFESYFTCSGDKLFQATGYRPKRGLKQGLSETLAWYQANRDGFADRLPQAQANKTQFVTN